MLGRFRTVILLGVCLTTQLFNAARVHAQAQAQGVIVDADGVLRTIVVTDKPGQLNKLRRQGMKRPTGAVADRTTLRYVSLAGVARAVRECLAAGSPIPDEIRYLAGIQQIQFLFVYPDDHDVVIAGPAEAWDEDAAGRVLGVSTRRPVLRLDDLVVALRVFPPRGDQNVLVGCTINQTNEGMRRLQQFMESAGQSLSSNRQPLGPALARGVRESLGLHDVVIWGLPDDSHLAQVMVEADYRMKLIGLGIDQPRVPGFKSYYSMIGAGDTGRLKVQHWWFVPEYEAITRDEHETAFEFRGQRAKLVGADDRVTAAGVTQQGATSGGSTERFAKSFTAHFEELARAVPVYAELQNAFDLVVLAALVQRGDWSSTTAPDMKFFYQTEQGYETDRHPVPKHVDSVVNVKAIGNRVATPVGGVELRPTGLVAGRSYPPGDGAALLERRTAARRAVTHASRWWAD